MNKKIALSSSVNRHIDWVKSYSCVNIEDGLAVHIRKHHPDCIEYLRCIEEIIQDPDYIGVNPNVKEQSFELVRSYGENVLIGIKLDYKRNKLYVASLYEITISKVHHRLESGRMKLID